MKKLIIMALCGGLPFSAMAQDGDIQNKNYIEAGINNGIYHNSYSGGVQGAFGIFTNSFGKKSAIDFRVRENYVTSPQREVGAITVTYRLYLNRGYYIGAGFAHNHEIAFDDYLNDIPRATLGNSRHIIHRTGFAIETGYDFKSLIKKGNYGLWPVLNFGMSYMLLDKEPNPLLTLGIGLRLGFKKLAPQQ